MKSLPKDSVSKDDYSLAVIAAASCRGCRRLIQIKDLDSWDLLCDTCLIKVN